ncbi:SAM-dependent methyltransferase [Aquipuribacter hungaricus]|uniref:SAM-dependent methyltransferase n=1 Tax=Aquipuribacter hungaricus TaxID=545624 RepID=A0ABV7WFB6_9MICO
MSPAGSSTLTVLGVPEPAGRGTSDGTGVLVDRLRRAGCVFAEDEAAVLLAAAADPVQREAWTRRRLAGEPLEVVVGRVRLNGLDLAVGPGVFVPRQRTAVLARLAAGALVEVAAGRDRPGVLVEACCGVAPVAALVARAVPRAEVHAADSCPAARRLARQNLPASAGVHGGDLLDALPPHLRGRVDVVAAVPPCTPAGQGHLLPPEARDHEPPAALFGGVDGLDVVRALLRSAGPWLAPSGRLLLEVGRPQLDAVARLAERVGASVVLHRDDQSSVAEVRGLGGPRGR